MDPALAGLDFLEVNAAFFDVNESCDQSEVPPEIELRGNNTGTTSFDNLAAWRFKAPANSEIREISFDEQFDGGGWLTNFPEGATNLLWQVFGVDGEGNAGVIEQGGRTEAGRSTPVNGHLVYREGTKFAVGEFPAGTTVFGVRLMCDLPTCPANVKNSLVGVFTRSIRVSLSDDKAPTIPFLRGPLFDSNPAHGAANAESEANDTGSGVAKGELLIDGHRVASESPGNGGQCREPFFTVVPCSPSAAFSPLVDTTTLRDASHIAVFRACDAAGVCASSQRTFTVQNAPSNTAPPRTSGTARAGAALTADPGRWTNFTSAPLSFSFQWLRCLAPGSCTKIAGATNSHYTPVGADVGERDEIEVTAAADASLGQVSHAVSAPSDPVADSLANKTPPTISGVAVRGSPLTADTGKWEDAAAAPISFAEQWLRCPAGLTKAAESARCEAIAGATGSHYTPLGADVGKRVMVRVTATAAAAAPTMAIAFSAPSAPVAGPAGRAAPQTRISKHPRKRTAITRAKFAFRSDQPRGSFQCKLDKKSFRVCRSPFRSGNLKQGHHVFQVRAINAQGVADPTPAVFRWRVS